MRCVFINLDEATERRAAVERSFAASAPAGCRLERFAAVPAAQAQREPGSLSGSAKGCFLSHLAVIEQHTTDEVLFVAEDDVRFSPYALSTAPQLLAPGLDLLFTDVIVGDPTMWLRLARLRAGLKAEGKFRVLDLSAFSFAGATAYLVNRGAAARIAAALRELGDLNAPYDIALRSLVHSRKISAAAVFPFVTSLAPSAESSQIADAGLTDLVSNAYRGLMHVNPDLGRANQLAARIEAEVDEESRLLGIVIAGAALPQAMGK